MKKAGSVFRYDFLFLVLILFLTNLRYFDQSIWPQHDTIYVFQSFYTFYNNWFLHHEFTRWFPYGTYGIQADHWQLFSLTPASYFCGFLGALFQIKKVLLLFKISILFEELFFLFGLYLLCGQLFKSKMVKVFVCLGGILSTVCLLQIYWNFRIYYLLPFVFYALTLFLKKKKPHYLWFAGIVSIFSLFGNPAYFAVLHLLILIIFSFPRMVQNHFPFKSLFEKSWQNILSFGMMIFISFIFIYFAVHMYDGVRTYDTGRNILTFQTDIQNFLTHGSGIGPEKFLEYLFAGSGDNCTLYAGLFPILFLFYGVFRVRRTEFFGVFMIILFLTFLSLGDQTFIARTIYGLFPPIRWFRYIGQIGGFMRLFVLLGSGFGLERFLEDMKQTPGNEKLLLIARNLFLYSGLIVAVLIVYFSKMNIRINTEGINWINFDIFSYFIFVAGLFSVWRLSSKSKTLAGIFVCLFLAIDLFLFQWHVVDLWPNRWAWAEESVSSVRPYQFQYQRVMPSEIPMLAPSGFAVVNKPGREKLNIQVMNFMQIDNCLEQYFVLEQPENVLRLLKIRADYLRNNLKNGTYVQLGITPVLLHTIGCHSSKLRFFSETLFTANPHDAEFLIEKVNDIDKILVLEGGESLTSPSSAQALDQDSLGNLHVNSFTFNTLRLTADVQESSGAWLYYADTYHPGWKAFVNGKDEQILKANLAFKAIHLQKGKNEVEFIYFDGLKGVLSVLIAVLGIVFSGIVLFMIFTNGFWL